MATMLPAECLVTVGVDSHKELHVAVALDQLGRRLGACTVATTPRGFGQLERWARRLGVIQRFGIEGTGSYAAGLARWLAARGHQVVEVTRPNRQTRRRHGKSDPIDAEAAARAALAGHGLVRPKGADGTVEMLRVLRMARRSAMKARTQTVQQLDSLVVTAPDQLRAKLRRLSLEQLVAVAAGLRPGELAGPLTATKLGLADPSPPPPSPQRRGRPAGPRALQADGRGRPAAAGPGRRRPPGGHRIAGRRRRQPRTAPQRGRVLDAVRRLPDPGVLGQGGAPSPEPGWGPTGQQRLVDHRGVPDELRPQDHRLRAAAYPRRQVTREIIRCLKRYIAREVHRDLKATLVT
jgi:hypothetical protein